MANNLAFPTIYLLPTHFDSDDLAKLESQIPTLTYDINEAEVVLGKVARKPRAIFELRSRKLLTEEVQPKVSDPVDSQSTSQPPAKRRKLLASAPAGLISDESTASGADSDKDNPNGGAQSGIVKTPSRTKTSQESVNGAEKAKPAGEEDNVVVNVVRLPWFTDSLAKGEVLPIDDYLVYQGRKKEGKPPEPTPPHTLNAEDILRRAREDENGSRPASQKPHFGRASTTHHPRSTHRKRPHFVQETTSEHEISQHLPPIPDYLHTDYSCQRPTPLTGPNDAFVEQLKKMRTIRTLEGDEVGVRAYSTSIAAVAAYPYPLLSPAGKA
jgi:DNA polymerase IV